MKTRFPKAVLIAVMALGMLVGLMPVNSFGAGGIEYVSRSWDGSQVISETKSCTDWSHHPEDILHIVCRPHLL